MAKTFCKDNFSDSATAWLLELELSRSRGNFERAALALRELERLGVVVRFRGSTGKKLTAAEKALPRKKVLF